jgi:hypothetical protein
VDFGDDVVDVLMRLGGHFLRLPTKDVGAANAGTHQRADRRPDVGKHFGNQHGGHAKHNAGKQRRFENGRADADDRDRRRRRQLVALVVLHILDRITRFRAKIGLVDVMRIDAVQLRLRHNGSPIGHRATAPDTAI